VRAAVHRNAAVFEVIPAFDHDSVAVFKKRLDKFWADQNVMFDWTADITGTGDRSEYIVESD